LPASSCIANNMTAPYCLPHRWVAKAWALF